MIRVINGEGMKLSLVVRHQAADTSDQRRLTGYCSTVVGTDQNARPQIAIQADSQGRIRTTTPALALPRPSHLGIWEVLAQAVHSCCRVGGFGKDTCLGNPSLKGPPPPGVTGQARVHLGTVQVHIEIGTARSHLLCIPGGPSAQPSNHHQPLSYYTQYQSCKGQRRFVGFGKQPNLLSLSVCPSLSVCSPVFRTRQVGG